MEGAVEDGEGFDSTAWNDDVLSKRLPDDCVEYIIVVISEKIKTEFELRERLKAIHKFAQESTKGILKDYIWQREAFELKLQRQQPDNRIPTSPTESAPSPLSWTLRGSTNFGDSINDEWLVVYLLRELSRQFTDAWIRLVDTDGEFLLIEAANALPKWLNPEIAENRVWINDGKLKVIPLLNSSTGNQSSNLTLEKAVSHIKSSPKDVTHMQSIEDEAFFRLRNYPGDISSSLHNALVRIPRRLAFVLNQNAAYISPAVEAFYLRDPISLKPLTTKDTGTLFFPPEDFVTVSVRFTRVGYAQLRSQEFKPPASWTAVTPHLSNEQVVTGMKVTCGFEMLLQDKANQDKRAVREMKLLLSDIDSGEDKLPTDEEVARWPQAQDDEKWLDINFEDLESELQGKRGTTDGKGEFGDKAAQENLRKMVSRFESFLTDDKAGIDGAELDDMDFDDEEETGSSEPDSEGEDKDGSFDEKEFEQAMREMMGMPPEEREASGLVDEARKLALEMEDDEEMERDEEEETRKVMEMLERELKSHGALDLKGLKKAAEAPGQMELMKGKGPTRVQDVDEGAELSSDDDNEDNDIDVDLLRNVLESFKGQAGMTGPASSMMAAMGIQMPRDEGNVKGKQAKK